jgi:ribbon-helix-helix CopG family protein
MLAPTKLLSVRLPEAERRRIKALAASQGLTLGEAIRAAFEAWASQLQREGASPPDALAMALSVAGQETPPPSAGAPSRRPGRPARAAKPHPG